MNAKVLLEYQWPYLLSFLPPAEKLDQTALEMGAIRRRRGVPDASTLLRLAWAYSLCGFSLRQTAAWAKVSEVALISDVALLKRLKSASEWLGLLLGLKLAERASPPSGTATVKSLRIVDATTISRPGSTGTDWRVHLGFDLSTLTIDHAELTDSKGGESLTRFDWHKGDIVLGDRGYAHRQGFKHVVDAGADFVVRLNLHNVPLQTSSGHSFDLLDALRRLPEALPGEYIVQVAPSTKAGIPPLPARLVAVRKSETAAEEARKRVLRERSKKSQKIDPRTLEAAGYVFVLTTLSSDDLSAKGVLELYRFRWQIELAFKRMKSLLFLGDLPARDPALARSFIYTKLLAALVLEDFTERFLAFSPWGYRLA